MHNSLIISISLLIILVPLWMWLFITPNNETALTKIGSVTTAPSQDLIKIISAQISNIEENSSIFIPFNQEKMNLFKQKLKEPNLTLEQLLVLSNLMPNSHMGYDSITSLSNPIDTTCLQLSKGKVGWYWTYGTDYGTDYGKSKKNSFMFYIIRVDLAPKQILKKLGYSLGQGTLYFISAGVGINGTWNYSPFTVVRAKNICDKNGQTITWFVNNTVSLTRNGDLTINVELESINSIKKKITINVTMKKIIPAYFNAPQGCAPCAGGAGTNYWSYPAMTVHGLISSDANKFTFSRSSIGWLDHQWISTYPKQPFMQIISTIISKGVIKGLGKYVWITLHFKDAHYMIAAFPPEKVALGDTFTATGQKYTKDKVIYGINCSVKITGFTKFNQKLGSVQFPNKYDITLEGKKYTLDGRAYGKCVTFDLTGNLHYSGSASLTGRDKNALSGFIEGNQFQSHELYTKTTLSILDMNYDKLQSLTIGGKLAYSYLIFILWILLTLIMLIVIVIQSVHGIKKLIAKKNLNTYCQI